jgi:UDP-N-acetylmuramyl pentapeptide phosphotransferase/UDP-N-acetylglucosamine-1-phosphate transferase
MQIIDHPDHRSSHDRPTVRGGGIALVVAIAIGYFAAGEPAAWPTLCAAVVGFGFVGLMEDARGVRVVQRLGIQLVLAVATVAALVHRAGLDPTFALFAIFAGSIFLVSFVNAFNFMDGVNGISGLQAVASGLAYTLIAAHFGAQSVRDVCLCMVGAALGFLPYNAPRARVFLGDTGSYALGAGLAASAVALGLAHVPIEAVVAPLSLYLADAGWTLLKRVRRGEPWHLPHRTHVYQQLTDRGLTHFQVAVTSALLSAVIACLGAVSITGNVSARGAADGTAVLLLATYLSSPSWFRRRSRPTRHASVTCAAGGARPRD